MSTRDETNARWRRNPNEAEKPSGTDETKSDANAQVIRNAEDKPEPKSPRQLDKPNWIGVLKRTLQEFKHDNLTDRAAALTYYGVLAIFPGFIVLVSILGLLGKNTAKEVATNVEHITPSSVGTFVNTIIDNAQNHHSAAGFASILGLVLALWSASGYVAAFMRASNAVYDIGEGRPIWKKIPIRIGLTVMALILLVLCAVIVVVSGPAAQRVGDVIGAGDAAVTAWSIAKWPVLLVIVSILFAIIFWASPNVKQGGIKWVSPGGIIAVVLWLIISGLFAIYVANFSSYSNTYGSLAGVIIFLVWLWLSNLAILLGLEVNAELERARAIGGGLPDDVTPYVEPRDTKKLSKAEQKQVAEVAKQRD
jgi:membrane protein